MLPCQWSSDFGRLASLQSEMIDAFFYREPKYSWLEN